MSKLAHSNDDTMQIIESVALFDDIPADEAYQILADNGIQIKNVPVHRQQAYSNFLAWREMEKMQSDVEQLIQRGRIMKEGV